MEISSFYISVPEIMIIRYAVPEIWCVTDLIVIFHFGLFFALATSLTAHKIKISKQWKKHLEISSFYTSVPKIINRLYCSWDMTRSGCNFCFNLGLYFSFLPLYSPKNKNFKKMKKKKKKSWRYYFTPVYQKLWLDDVQFLRYGARQMDKQMDGRVDGKGDIYRRVPHLIKSGWFWYNK